MSVQVDELHINPQLDAARQQNLRDCFAQMKAVAAKERDGVH